LFGNLVLNAIKYGSPDAPVRVVMTGEERDVHFEVRNRGPAIERLTLDRIFETFQRGLNHGNSCDADGNLGLALYIAREIAKAHGREIEARSDETETVFAVRLPRRRYAP
jgi:signal transduction histidine kinase